MGKETALKAGVAEIMIDCPPVKPLTLANHMAIGERFGAADGRNDIRCILYAKAGMRAFCAPIDLDEFFRTVVEKPALVATGA